MVPIREKFVCLSKYLEEYGEWATPIGVTSLNVNVNLRVVVSDARLGHELNALNFIILSPNFHAC